MIKRSLYLEKIKPFIGTDVIKVITGIRRSGKSVMLQLIQEELLARGVGKDAILAYNFEQLSNSHLCEAMALHADVLACAGERKNVGKLYLFFDEIQDVEGWEKCINSLRVSLDCDIYLTGSNAQLLSGELATYLAGRYVQFIIYPFSLAEFMEARQLEAHEAFREYLKLGGMPFISQLPQPEEAGMQYLRDIYASVLLKDVVKRNNIRDVELLERVIRYLLANIGHTISASSIAKYLKNEKRSVSSDTVMNYLRLCCQAFLFLQAGCEDLPSKRILSAHEKYYVMDHGIREAVFGANEANIDQVLENMVCVELLRRGYRLTTGRVGTKEVDFIAQRGEEKIYLQVAYLLASPETIKREFGVYDSVNDHYPKYVLSLDEFNLSRNGIIHMNIRDFLLMN